MNKAQFVRNAEGMNGDARLYKLDVPVKYDGDDTDHVIVSGINNMWGRETFIFPANDVGHVLDWLELDGSFAGDIDHERALRGAGYEVAD